MDSKSPDNGMRQIECSENLMTDQNPYLKPQV